MDDWDADTGAVADDWETADAGFGFADDWDVEPAEAPAAAPATTAPAGAKKEAKPKKMTLKEKLKLKEAEEAAARAARASAAPISKEDERKAIEESEKKLASDLFGGSGNPEASSSAAPVNARAAALAASTGLYDGYDGIAPINEPDSKTGPDAAPSVLDAINLDDKNMIPLFVADLTRKIKDYNNSANALLLLKEIVNGICPEMKLDHVQELLRVVTVQKNTAADKEKTKKKASKKSHLAKDRAGDDYDDYF